MAVTQRMKEHTQQLHDKLHALERSFGFTDEDLERAVEEVTTPRRVELPRWTEKKTKEEQKQEKAEKKVKRKKKVEIAAWFLEEFLKPEFAWDLYYLKYPDFDELVDKAYDDYMGILWFNKCWPGISCDPLTFDCFADPTPQDTELDIPDEQWDDFCKWCKKHPLKSPGDIFPRRQRFKRHMRKRRKKFYDPKRLQLYDPLFAADQMKRKQMIKNLRRINRDNEIRCKKFEEFIGSLNIAKGAVDLAKFTERTEIERDQAMKRMRNYMRQTGGPPPTKIRIDIDDEPPIYVDYDWDPNAYEI